MRAARGTVLMPMVMPIGANGNGQGRPARRLNPGIEGLRGRGRTPPDGPGRFPKPRFYLRTARSFLFSGGPCIVDSRDIAAEPMC